MGKRVHRAIRPHSATAIWIALLVLTPLGFAAPPATTTAFTILSNGNPVTTLIQGNLVTLSATVIAGSAPLTVGQVEFCDAAAPYCTDIHQLALAQLTSAGTATFRFVPPAGTHQYKAVFLGTTSHAGSTSVAQMLTVTPSGYKYLSTTTLASSGSPGNYTLTATVTGGGDPVAPTGTVSFLDTNNANFVLGTATLTPLVGQFSFLDSAIFAGNRQLLGDNALYQPVAGDFNMDGIPDLVVGSGYPTVGPFTIELGNGDGTFTQGQTLPISGNAYGVVADFNGDGIPDIAFLVGSALTTNPVYSIQIELGNGDGTFALSPPMTLSLPVTLTPNSSTVFIVAVGDFNGDGKADLVLQYEVGGTGQTNLWFLPGNGDGTFGALTTAYQTYETPCAYNVAVADFNGDGNLDLACPHGADGAGATYPNSYVTILIGDGHGSFSKPGANVTVGAGGTSIAVAEFNGDGKADLAAVSFWFSTAVPGPDIAVSTVAVALGNGDGTFGPTTFIAPYENSEDSIAVGDFNGDGFPDFAITYEGGYANIGGGLGLAPNLLGVFLGNGDGTFSESDAPLPFGTNSPFLYAADFNRDGRWDVAIDQGVVNVFLSQPTSATATVTGISPVGTGIHLVDASYPGIPTILSPSLSNTVGLQAEPVPTSLTLLASPATGVFQQPFTLAATLAPTSAQNHTPTGTVTFSNSGVSLGTATYANGVAALTVSTILPVGTYSLTATYSGDTNFQPSTGSLQYVISASPSFITFTVPNHTFGDPPFAVTATSASPGAFTYSVLSGPATISGNTVTLTGAGAVILQARQAASGLYPAGIQNAIFTVAKEAQTITFPAPASPVIPSSPPISLSATASSGLPVAFSILSGPATSSGSTVTITGLGTVVVAADQAGNANFAAATEVTHTIVVAKANPAIAIAGSPNPVFLQAPVTLSATVSSSISTPTGSVVFSSGSTVLGTGTLSSGTASITASTLPAGSDPITAVYGGDGNFNGITSQAMNETVQDFTLTLTSSATQTIQYAGTATYALAITPINGPTIPAAINFALSGYPAGSILTFSPASLPAGSGTSNLTVTIQVPAVIGSLQHRPRDRRSPAQTLAALALCGLILPIRRRMKLRGRRMNLLGCILLLLTSAVASTALTACGNDVILPLTQTFSVTVSANSGTLTHTAAATLVVN